MPSSDVRSSETSAQNARGKKFPRSLRVQIFVVLIFAFWSWVAKIAKIWTSRKFPAIRYTVSSQTPPLLAHYFEAKVWKGYLLEYSICNVHTPFIPLSLQSHKIGDITTTAMAFQNNSSFTKCVLYDVGLCSQRD